MAENLDNFFYLAGGTGLAFQIGHRFSYDFDFFSPDPFRNDALKQLLDESGPLQVFQDSRGTLEGAIGETRVTFLHYAYPLLEKPVPFHGIKLASVLDIALMKISALSSRGSKKDFLDLYFLRDMFSFADLLDLFEKKYQGSGYNMLHIVKSLVYFDDAEEEPMPRMLQPAEWEQVKKYFMGIENQLIKRLI